MSCPCPCPVPLSPSATPDFIANGERRGRGRGRKSIEKDRHEVLQNENVDGLQMFTATPQEPESFWSISTKRVSNDLSIWGLMFHLLEEAMVGQKLGCNGVTECEYHGI
jgi:hypothetical protein